MSSRLDENSLVWAREGEDLLAILAELSSDPSRAVREGRVFVAGRRVDRVDWPVCPGERVEVRNPRATALPLELIDEHAGVLAVHKPAGVPTEPDRQGSQGCLLDELAQRLGVPVSQLHALNRLDANVSGVVLVATTRSACRWAQSARDRSEFSRQYLAIGAGISGASQGEWSAPVRTHRGQLGSAALTRFRVVGCSGRRLGDHPASLLLLEPSTGRTHQLRIHSAEAGMPLLGDRAYGGPGRLLRTDGSVRELDRVALHAARVALRTPAGRIWRVEAKVPEALIEWWACLDGPPGAWEAALAEARR